MLETLRKEEKTFKGLHDDIQKAIKEMRAGKKVLDEKELTKNDKKAKATDDEEFDEAML